MQDHWPINHMEHFESLFCFCAGKKSAVCKHPTSLYQNFINMYMFVHDRKNRTDAVREGQAAWKKLGGTVASVNQKESSAHVCRICNELYPTWYMLYRHQSTSSHKVKQLRPSDKAEDIDVSVLEMRNCLLVFNAPLA